MTYSPQARLTVMELVVLLTPATGAHCVPAKAPVGVYPPREPTR